MAEELPLFPLGTVLFPETILPLHIFEERYRRMLARRTGADPAFGVVLTRRGREVADRPEIYDVGTAASIVHAVGHPDGRADIVVRGGRRFRVAAQDWREGYLTAAIEWIDADDETADDHDAARLLIKVKAALDSYLESLEQIARIGVPRVELGDDPRRVGYAIGAAMPFAMSHRQRLLEAPTDAAMLETLLRMLRHERDLLTATGLGGAAIDHPGRRFTAN